MGGLNANYKDLNIIFQYFNPTGNGILRNPDRTRTRRKPGLKENPDSKKIRTRLREMPDSPLEKPDFIVPEPTAQRRGLCVCMYACKTLFQYDNFDNYLQLVSTKGVYTQRAKC